jgi:hypothetical protein
MVTVTNPGGLMSAPQLFEITTASNMAFALSNLSVTTVCPPVTGDFNGDGRTDIAICPANELLAILLSNGDGTFQELSPFGKSSSLNPCLTADVNQDGKQDLILCGTDADGRGAVQVLLGNNDGTFPKAVTDEFSSGISLPMVAGDFNGDGKLDLAVATEGSDGQIIGVSILLGNGDGTFQGPIFDSLPGLTGLAVGDFNRDGKLDMVAVQNLPSGEISILLGDGDGTFQTPVTFGSGAGGPIGAADLNGDGKLDIVWSGIVFLGNGDGTFDQSSFFDFLLAQVGDVDGDGVPDLVGTYITSYAGSGIDVALGNGDGTFQPPISYQLSTVADEFEPTLTDGIFNGDGRLDLLYWDQGNFQGNEVLAILLQTDAELPLIPFQFGTQDIGTTSPPQNITLTNVGTSSLNISSIALAGINPGSFLIESNGCGTSLGARASCTVSIAFSPVDSGNLTAALTFTDSALASPQSVSLLGFGVGMAPPMVQLSPTSLTFPPQVVGTASAPQTITLTNTGNLTLMISGIIFSGTESPDFSQNNNCGSSVAGGASCSINVTFTPSATGSRTATMNVIDNAMGSPQMVPVSGTGVSMALSAPVLSPTSLTLTAGQSGSFTATVTVAAGEGAVTFTCTGAPAGVACSPGTPVVNANGTVTSTIAVRTTARGGVPPVPDVPPLGSSPLLMLVWGLCGIAGGLGTLLLSTRLRPCWSFSQRAACATLVLLVMSIGLLAGCGSSGGGQAGTPAGTYMLTVTASASGQSASSTFTLTVK